MIAISPIESIDRSTLVRRLRAEVPRAVAPFPIQLAYLYGSAANGLATPISDVDIGLVAGQAISATKQLEIEMDVQVELAHRIGVRRADVRVIDRLPLLLRGQVVTSGILLYARTEEARLDFETSTRDLSFDFHGLADSERPLYFASLLRGQIMVNRDKVEGLVRRQQEYLGYLRTLAQVPESEFVADPEKTGAAKYYCLVAIETCIDLGNHVISASNWRAPVDYGDVFTVLGEQQVLSPELTRSLERMAGFRNRLVHVYAEVDDHLLYEFLRARLGDLDQFRTAIVKLVA